MDKKKLSASSLGYTIDESRTIYEHPWLARAAKVLQRGCDKVTDFFWVIMLRSRLLIVAYYIDVICENIKRWLERFRKTKGLKVTHITPISWSVIPETNIVHLSQHVKYAEAMNKLTPYFSKAELIQIEERTKDLIVKHGYSFDHAIKKAEDEALKRRDR